MIREIEYDEVFDAQLHFRSILDSMARPGKINILKEVSLNPPEGLTRGASSICLSLLNRDVGFYFSRGNAECEDYIRVNTGSQPDTVEEADFILVDCDESEEIVTLAKEGILTYPEQGATFIIQCNGLSDTPIPGSIGIEMKGPGIADSVTVYVLGLDREWIEALSVKNSEFPLGVDAILAADAIDGLSKVVCIPRTATLRGV